MPRARQYRSNAERQAAYRERHPERQLPREDELAAAARTVHSYLQEAVEKGVSPLPSAVVGWRVDETMRRLCRYLRERVEAAPPAPEEEHRPQRSGEQPQ